MNYYLNVSFIGSSTKNDRCQDVTLLNFQLKFTLQFSIKIRFSIFNLNSHFNKIINKTILLTCSNAVFSLSMQ